MTPEITPVVGLPQLEGLSMVTRTRPSGANQSPFPWCAMREMRGRSILVGRAVAQAIGGSGHRVGIPGWGRGRRRCGADGRRARWAVGRRGGRARGRRGCRAARTAAAHVRDRGPADVVCVVVVGVKVDSV